MARLTLLGALVFALSACGSTAPVPEPPPVAGQPVPAPAQDVPMPSPETPDTAISPEGIGPARIGMTLGALKQAMPDADFERHSPFMVDIDAIAVSVNGEVQFHVLHLSSDVLTDTDPIELLMTDNPAYRTREGVGPGTPIKTAEGVYGKAGLEYSTASESRESVTFASLPYRNIRFRSDQWKRQTFAGLYPDDPGREYFKTSRYREGAVIGAVMLMGAAPGAPAPSGSEGTAASMQGSWQSTDDPKSTMEISGTRVLDRYDGAIVATSTLTFVNRCDDRTEAPNGRYFLLTADDEPLCYFLLKAGANLLEYSNLPRGNTLSFRRIGPST